MRWFARGALPSQLVEQFCDVPGKADIEIRTDTYRISPSHGIGLKRRNGGPLEVKIRQSRIGYLHFDGSASSPIEGWRKIIGLNHPVFQLDDNWEWAEVEKVVLTRTYGFVGAGRVGLVERDLSVPGCDVELAAVTVGDTEAWTLALEAWGPARRRLLQATLTTFTAELPFPEALVAELEYAMGYPEWLATVAAGD